MYRSLDIDKTISTIRILNNRIEERFPDSGLSKVCSELEAFADESRSRINWISQPIWWLRISVFAFIGLGVITLLFSITAFEFTSNKLNLVDVITLMEASINDLILIGAAIFFLVTIETRIKRSRALDALHELRTIAHVIDMHQLTKDPKGDNTKNTESSPKRQLTGYELARYLDYCSEMLSLTGKVSALYAQGFKDQVVLNAIQEIEHLTTGLSNKVWQKIVILGDRKDTE